MAKTSLTQKVSYGGETFCLNLQEVTLLSPKFKLLVQIPTPPTNGSVGNIFEHPSPLSGNTMYYQVNPKNIHVPTFLMGQIDGRPGWCAVALQRKDGSLCGHIFSPRGEHLRFLNADRKHEGDIESVSKRIVAHFFDRCLGPNLTRENFYLPGASKPDLREYDLVFDSDYSHHAAWLKDMKKKSSSTPKQEEVTQNVADEMFLAYLETAAVNLRDTLLFPRLKTLIVRPDDTENPYNSTDALKSSQAAMWGDNHAKGIVVSREWGTANATRGGFACQIRRLSTATYLHEHDHCLGPQHNISGAPEQHDIMTGGHSFGIRRLSAPTVKVMRVACDEKKGFRHIPPLEFGLPPYAALDLASIPQGQKQPVQIDVLSNDAISSGAKIELIQVEPRSARGQPVRLNRGKVEYTAPTDWVGTDSFYYSVRSRYAGQWLYSQGLVQVEVHNRVKRFQAEDVCDKKQIKSALPRMGAQGDAFARLNERTPSPLIWKMTIPKKGEYGLKLRYQEASVKKGDPRLIAVLDLVVAGQTIRLQAPPQLTVQENDTQWGTINIPGLQLPSGKQTVELKLISGAIQIDSIDLEQGFNIQINFENGIEDRLSESNYFFDKGEVLAPQPCTSGRLTYGWSSAKKELEPDSSAKGLLQSRLLDTSIPLDRDTWSIKLPNGKYNLTIFCGDSYNRKKQINTLTVNGKTIKDPDGYLALDATLKPLLDQAGEKIMDPVDYLSGNILVTKGKIEIKAGKNSKKPTLSYIELTRIEP